MKRFLSLLCLFSISILSTPAHAVPPPNGGGHVLRAGPGIHRLPPPRRHYAPPPRRYGGFVYRPYRCDYTMRVCNDFYYRPYYGSGVMINIPIRFQ